MRLAYAIIFMLALLGLLLFYAVVWFEKRIIPWHVSQHAPSGWANWTVIFRFRIMKMDYLEGGDWRRNHIGGNDSTSKVRYIVIRYPTVSILSMERKI